MFGSLAAVPPHTNRSSSGVTGNWELASAQTQNYQRLSGTQPTLPARLGNLAKNCINTITSREFLQSVSTFGLMLAAGAGGWAGTVSANRSSSIVDAMGRQTQDMHALLPTFHPSYQLTPVGTDASGVFPNLTSAQPVIEGVTGDMIAQGQYAHDQVAVAQRAFNTIRAALHPLFKPNASSELDNMAARSLFEAERQSLSTQYGLLGLAEWVKNFLAELPVGRNITAQLNTTTPHDNFFSGKELLGMSGNDSVSEPLTDCAQSPVGLGPVLEEQPYAGLFYSSPAESVWVPGRDRLPKVLGEEFAKVFFNARCLLDDADFVDDVFDIQAIAIAFHGRMDEVEAALDTLAANLTQVVPTFNKTEFLQASQQAFQILSANANISTASLQEAVAKLESLSFQDSQHRQLIGAGAVFAVGVMITIAAKLLEAQLHGAQVAAATPSARQTMDPEVGSLELVPINPSRSLTPFTAREGQSPDVSTVLVHVLAQSRSGPEASLINRATKALMTLGLLAGSAAAGASMAGFYNSRERTQTHDILSEITWPQTGNMPPDLPHALITGSHDLQRQNNDFRALASVSMKGLKELDDAALGRRSNSFADLNFYDLRGLFDLLKASTNAADFLKRIPPFVAKFFKDDQLGAHIAPQLKPDFHDEPNAVSVAELTKNANPGSAQYFNPPENQNLSLTIPGILQPLIPVISNSTDLLEAMGWVGRDLIAGLNGTQIASMIQQTAGKLDGVSSNDSYIAPRAIERSFGQRISSVLYACEDSVGTYGSIVPPRNEAAFHNNTAEIVKILNSQQRTNDQLQNHLAAFKTAGDDLLEQQTQQRQIGIAGAGVVAGLVVLAMLCKFSPALYRQAYTALGLAPQRAANGLNERLMPTAAPSEEANASEEANPMVIFATQLAQVAEQNPAIFDQVRKFAWRMTELPSANSGFPTNTSSGLSRAHIEEVE